MAKRVTRLCHTNAKPVKTVTSFTFRYLVYKEPFGLPSKSPGPCGGWLESLPYRQIRLTLGFPWSLAKLIILCKLILSAIYRHGKILIKLFNPCWSGKPLVLSSHWLFFASLRKLVLLRDQCHRFQLLHNSVCKTNSCSPMWYNPISTRLQVPPSGQSPP